MREVFLFLVLACVVSVAGGRPPGTTIQSTTSVRPSFDPRCVVRELHSSHPGPSSVGRELAAFDEGEFLIDTGGIHVPAPDNQSMPAVAFDGVNYLVVWSDSGSSGAYNICGARVTSDGTVLDSTGFVVSSSTLNPYRPAVAFDGTNFLVVWETYPNDGSSDIYGARVAPSGEVLDTAGIAISTADWYQVFAAVAFDGTNYLVVWENSTDDSCNVRGARVSPAGVVLDTAGIRISAGAGFQACPALSFDGTDFLVAWMDTRNDSAYDVYGARVTPAGVLLDTSGIAICTATGYQLYPVLAFDGSNSLVVWGDMRSGTYCHVYGSRVTPQGDVLDTAGIAIAQPIYGGGYFPSVIYDGSNFLAAWHEFRVGTGTDIRGARVTAGGVVLDTVGFAIADAEQNQSLPAAASAGTNSLVVWQDDRGGSTSHIRGARVSPDGVLLDSLGIVMLRTVSLDEECPAAACDGANFLVAWQAGGWAIRGARVTADGTALDPSGLVIAQTGWRESHPALAFGGENFLVVWEDSCGSRGWDIYGARVTPQGEVLDPAGFAVAQAGSDQWHPAVASDGTNYLVVWQDDRSGSTWSDVYGVRVTPGGKVLDSAEIVISGAVHQQGFPAVAFDGVNFLVVWQDARSGSGYDIYGTLVTPQGKLLGVNGFPVSMAAADQHSPALAFDGSNYLVTWQDGRSDINYDIYGARVTPQLVVLDTSGIALTQAAGDQSRPALTFDGANYLAVWQDGGSGDFDIYGARVTPAGTVFDRGMVVGQQRDQSYPGVCSSIGGQTLLVYQGWAGVVGGKSYDAERVWGRMDPSPGIEDGPKPQSPGRKCEPTIIHGVLFLPRDMTGLFYNSDRVPRPVLMDANGRKVLDLHFGANDVSRLAPGVYFVRLSADGRSTTRKLVLTG
jgi:large repetitive protein